MKGKENLRRDWRKYNEELVVRGTFYFDFSFVENWKEELQRMNRGKVGRLFRFPEGFIQWQAI